MHDDEHRHPLGRAPFTDSVHNLERIQRRVLALFAEYGVTLEPSPGHDGLWFSPFKAIDGFTQARFALDEHFATKRTPVSFRITERRDDASSNENGTDPIGSSSDTLVEVDALFRGTHWAINTMQAERYAGRRPDVRAEGSDEEAAINTLRACLTFYVAAPHLDA